MEMAQPTAVAANLPRRQPSPPQTPGDQGIATPRKGSSETGPHPRPSGDPLRRRLGRRDAADRGPVHRRLGGVRQRHLDPAELPGRDPRARRHAARGVQLPVALRQLRHHDSRRPAGRAGGDEPGRAQGQHRRPAPRRRDHRRHRRLHQAQPGQGRLRRRSADRRLAGRLPGARAGPDRDDGRGGQAVRAVPQGRVPGQEHVRPRPAVLALPPADRGHDQLPVHQVRVQARHPRRQHHRVQDRVRVRRDHRGVRGHLRGGPGADAGRPLPADLRQPRAGVRADHRGPEGRAAAVPRRLPDHPGLGRAARAEQAQAVRGDHLPGRGRDRRRRRRARRELRRTPRGHHHLRPGRRAQGRDHRAWR